MRNWGTRSWTQIAWVLRRLSEEEIWNFSEHRSAKISGDSVQDTEFFVEMVPNYRHTSERTLGLANMSGNVRKKIWLINKEVGGRGGRGENRIVEFVWVLKTKLKLEKFLRHIIRKLRLLCSKNEVGIKSLKRILRCGFQ